MKKVVRSRKGFTLAEIILVVAIIVILASAAAVGVVEKINRANQNAEAVRLHAAGGHFWTVEGGKVVELDPNDYDPNNPYHRSGGAMDMQYDEVKYIQGTVPNNPPQTYNPGGGGLNPGTGGSGGSGGDNPGDNPGGGGTPELWNGHTEEWWNENDAKWEEKIQQLKDQGIPPENIHVTKDERGHITGVTWSDPNSGSGSSGSGSTGGSGSSGSGSSGSGSGASGSGSGSSSTGGFNGTTVSTGATVSAGAGVYAVSESNGKTSISLATDTRSDTHGENRVGFTITKNGDNYVLSHDSAGDAGSGWYTLPESVFPNRYTFAPYTLNADQKAWLEQYGITLH